MSKAKAKIISNDEPLKVWFWSLTAVLILCLFSYSYLVRGVIVDVVARQNIEGQLSSLNTQVLNLESEYLNLENGLTLDKAQTLGFVAAPSQKFVMRNTDNPSLSLLTPGL